MTDYSPTLTVTFSGQTLKQSDLDGGCAPGSQNPHCAPCARARVWTHPAEQAHHRLRLPDELVEVKAFPRERDAVRARASRLLHVFSFDPQPKFNWRRRARGSLTDEYCARGSGQGAGLDRPDSPAWRGEQVQWRKRQSHRETNREKCQTS